VSSRRLFGSLLALALVGAGSFGIACAQPGAGTTLAPPSSLKAPDTIDERVRGCTACHGVHGEGSGNDYFPRLAGKPAQYLYNQLVNFREGRRRYPPMNYLLTYLGDDYLHEISNYFANQHPSFPPPTAPSASPATLAQGQKLAMHGDPSRGIPACAACHGMSLTGLQPGIPGLVGLHVDYLSAQIGAFRSGTRRAKAPDCMTQVASKLNDDDVAALTAWLAAQPAPANAAPAAANSMRLPLACGSEPQ
jgi:cytochrome c553